MKKLFTILSVLLISYITLHSQAPNVEGFVPLRVTYNSVKIIDENTFIAVGTNGAVIISKDGGKTWDRRYLENGENIVDIEIFNNEIFLLCNDGKLYKSNDLGKTFTLLYILENAKPNSISINKKGYGVIACDSSKLFFTTDGGNIWSENSIIETINIQKAIIDNNNHIYICILGGVLEFKFGEVGYSFYGTPKNCNNCYPINPQMIDDNYYILFNGELLKKTFSKDFVKVCEVDSMTNYQIINDSTIIFLKKTRWSLFDVYEYNINKEELVKIGDYSNIFLIDNIELIDYDNYRNLLIGVGPNSMIYLSDDKGRNFKQISNFNTNLNSLFYTTNVRINSQYYFLNENTFFCNGTSANLYKTTDGGMTFTTQDNILNTAQIHPVEIINFNNEKDGFCFVNYNNIGFMKTTDGGVTFDYHERPSASDKLLMKINDNKFIFIHYNEVYQGFSRISSTSDFFGSYTEHYLDTSWIKDFELINDNEIVFGTQRQIDDNKIFYDCFLGFYNLKNDTFPNYKNIPNIKRLHYIHKFDTGEFLLYGVNFEKVDNSYKNYRASIFKSTDNGDSWYEVYGANKNGFWNQDFFNDDDGNICFIDASNIRYSTDKGETWLEKPRFIIKSKELTTLWYKVFGSTIYAGTLKISNDFSKFDIYIYKSKTDKDIITSVENQVESKPIWWVSNPYPNPYTNTITIDYAFDMIYSQNDFKFTLYNVLGVKIADLVPDFSLTNGNQGKVSLNIPYSNQLFYLHINFKGTNKVYPIFGISN